ncbi:NnrU family protein [Jannaschia donghaensis]|uniref:Putative membrane protein n=1 Tax=Jannaschia donghaensis TaxID=420998 RepID=A0A0M6YH38_9RHOB|nr:NnrU family protein [Jannaschia donghaensis]CTQ49005.1 putative membrane protein [Jannaschia donghaensis]
MTYLILGLALWVGAHMFKRVAPGPRARIGDPGKGLIAVLLVGSVILMIVGYRAAPYIPVWEPPSVLRHVNNLLMVVAFYVYGVGATKGLLSARLRHPQLTGFTIWAGAHLLVNGDLAAMILFGGLLVWALAEIALINRSQPWQRPEVVSIKGDLVALIVGLILMSIAAGVHIWLGVNPFGG